ncbi:glycosyltransferase [Clostridium perfringens]|uniref:glycosyltransferase n=1 Tax=Clostridium perfringens TaxID=1502 RepID=UPI0039E9914A
MKYVTIMICTYKRNSALKKTIESILNLEYDLSKLTLVIVDNDKNGEAKKIINGYKEKIKIYYDIEEIKGISYARNRCLKIARQIDSEYVAFIDDDEIVTKKWLSELIRILEFYNSDIVRGPVIGSYLDGIPSWYKKANLDKINLLEDGTELEICFTGNVLMKYNLIIKNEFDTKYALTGGEDTKFFMSLHKSGNVIRYSKKAVIYEEVLKDRLTFKYFVKRAFKDSANYAIIEKEVYNTSKFYRILKSTIKLLLNLIIFPISIFNGFGYFMKILKKIIMSLGELYGIITSKSLIGY